MQPNRLASFFTSWRGQPTGSFHRPHIPLVQLFIQAFDSSHTHMRMVSVLFFVLFWGWMGAAPTNVALAQVATEITSDGSLGTTVTANGAVHDITGGARPGGGPNLFHSFGNFSVGSGDTANFLNDSGLPTNNILSRVTGGNPSEIFGTIQTTDFGQASLYLMNPAGVVFGPTASLNVGGSFHVTTADYLKFGAQEVFYADLARDSVLTVAPPQAFGFLKEKPAGITVGGSTLSVEEHQTFALVGGILEISGSLKVANGEIGLVSVSSPGEVITDTFENSVAANGESIMEMGPINLSQGALLDVSGNPGGTVVIRGGSLTVEGGGEESGTAILAHTQGESNHSGHAIDIVITDEVVLSATNGGHAIIQTGSIDSGHGGSIHITAGEGISLNGDSTSGFDATIESNARGLTASEGAGGSIDIRTGTLQLRDGAFVKTETSGNSKGGDINITADRLNISGIEGSAQISAKAFDTGASGQLHIEVPDILLQGGGATLAGIETQVGFPSQASSPTEGNIHIAGDRIQILDGAQIVTSVYGEGIGGTIDLNANSLHLSGLDMLGQPAAITAVLPFPASGRAGDIDLNSDTIEVANGAEIGSFSSSFGDAGNMNITTRDLSVSQAGLIVSSNVGIGVAGNIDIKASRVVLQGPGLPEVRGTGIEARSSVQALGGGNIMLDTEELNILDGAKIQTSTLGNGAGGAIHIMSDELLIAGVDQGDNSFEGTSAGIFSSTRQITGFESFAGGPGGDIFIETRDITLRDLGTISVTSTSPGRAGNIEISSENITLKDEALISGESTFRGNAGKIDLTASDIIRIGNSAVTTEANEGAGGSITIDATQLELTNTEISASVINVPEGVDSNTGQGDIALTAETIQMAGGSIQAATTGTRAAGNITVVSGPLELTEGGRIEASTRGVGDAGSITVTSTGDVTVSGLSPDGQTRSGIFAKTQTSGGGGLGGGNSSGGGSGSGGGGGSDGGGSGSGGGSGGGTGGSVAGNAGAIVITAHNLTVLAGAQIDSSTTSGGDGGVVDIHTTETVSLAGANSRLTSDASRGNGKGGNILVTARDIFVRDDASVSAKTGGKGRAGDIRLNAQNSVVLQSGGTVSTSTSGSGRGGTINVQASRILLDGIGSSITAETIPPFADLVVALDILHPKDSDLTVQLDSPSGTRVALFSQVGGSGDNFTDTNLDDRASKNITSGTSPFTGRFRPREPLGQLFGEDTSGTWTLNIRDRNTNNVGTLEGWTLRIGDQEFQGTAGSIPIPDNGTLRVPLMIDAGPSATVQGAGDVTGTGGNITINADMVTLQNGGLLSATTRGSGQGGTINVNATGIVALSGTNSGLFTNAQANGTGGRISVQAGQTTLDAGATISAASSGSGAAGTITLNTDNDFSISNSLVTSEANLAAGGNVIIQAGDDVSFTNNARVNAKTSGPENAGEILIEAGESIRLINSAINAEATQADGGNIKLQAPEIIQLVDSQITSSVDGGPSTVGGNISLDPEFIILQNSQILANAFGGQGGNITLEADVAILIDPFSLIDASSALGINGSVNIQAPIQNLSGTIAPLKHTPTNISTLYGSRCVANTEGQYSTFVERPVAGSLPAMPGGFLTSPLLHSHASDSSSKSQTDSRALPRNTSDQTESILRILAQETLPTYLTHWTDCAS